MYCRTHPAQNGVNTCNQCGEWLCEECTIEVNGRIFCKNCLAKSLGGEKPAPALKPPCRVPYRRHINGFLLFIFTFMPPGLNYMYEGLIKRGLITLSAFFMLTYVASLLSTPLFGFIAGIVWITCAFDGFHVRRRINAGEEVADDVNDILCFLNRNKKLFISFAIIVAFLAICNSLAYVGVRGMYWVHAFAGRFGNLIPIAVIVVGLCVLFRRPKHKHTDKNNEE